MLSGHWFGCRVAEACYVGLMLIVCLTHVAFEGPARIADWARERGHELRVIRADQVSDDFPLRAPDALIVMGGPMSANDSYPWLLKEAALIEQAVKLGLPVLGVCLGAQILARIFGARIYAAASKEIGWWPLRNVADTAMHQLNWQTSMVPLHWHGETFDLPGGAIRLAESEVVPNQAFQLEPRVLGLQFHIEATIESVSAIARGAAADISGGPWEQSVATMIAESAARCAALKGPLYATLDRFLGQSAPLDASPK